MFSTKRLSEDRDAVAPDGSDVRILLQLSSGSLAHFQLAPGQTSVAIHHRTVEEIWYVTLGRGEMWRKLNDFESTIELEPGVCLDIPTGTDFQFRTLGSEPLTAIGVTIPPWPGASEAIRSQGPWAATVEPGPGLAAR
ncbi:MAG: cupin domain-containing protein [Acidimicrobiaceae bacterium]|nr:cupin domain-containing protein [Acidimicrobiaceae bacterium]